MIRKNLRPKSKKLEWRFFIVLLAVALAYFGMRVLPQQKNTAAASGGSFYYVSRVIDGDTIKLSNGEHVRLIGIDTPESRYNKKVARDASRSSKDMRVIIAMGKEASDFTRRLVEGKRVRLDYDVERRDKYGRTLAYVYLDDGTFVNAKIMEEGYAQVMTIPPNVKHAGYFLKLQQEARSNNKGLWKAGAGETLF